MITDDRVGDDDAYIRLGDDFKLRASLSLAFVVQNVGLEKARRKEIE